MAVRHEVSSGGIIYKVTKKGVLVAFIRDSVGKMTFPKGHVEKGERIEQTARREVYEETGLKGLRLVRKLGKIQITFEDRYVRKGDTIKKDIHYFLFEAPENARFKRVATADGNERIRGRKWVPLKDTKKWSEYDDMEFIVEKAVSLIARQVRRRNKRDPFKSEVKNTRQPSGNKTKVRRPRQTARKNKRRNKK